MIQSPFCGHHTNGYFVRSVRGFFASIFLKIDEPMLRRNINLSSREAVVTIFENTGSKKAQTLFSLIDGGTKLQRTVSSNYLPVHSIAHNARDERGRP